MDLRSNCACDGCLTDEWLMQDTRAVDGRNNMLRYLGKRLVSEDPPQAVLSTEVPTTLSAPLKTSLLVSLSLCLTIL